MKKPSDRFHSNHASPQLYEYFVNTLSFSEIQTFLLEAFDEKRRRLGVKDVFRQYESDPYVQPSAVDPRLFLKLEQLLFSRLPAHVVPLELSPVSPLGCCSQLGTVSQKRVISTIRKSEVCSDPTNALALEAAKRRRASGARVVLAASMRVLRGEKTRSKDTFPHFRLFSVCFAGKDRGNRSFEIDACADLAHFYDDVLSGLAGLGYSFSDAKMLFKFRGQNALERFQQAFSAADSRLKNLSLQFVIDPSEKWNYYGDIRFNLFIRVAGTVYFIADGGDTDWTQKVLNNKKERYFISGLGTERLLAVLNF